MRVTFGRYIPTGSIIHRMDPRLKLFMIIVLIVSVFFPIGFTGYIILSSTILILFATSKLSWRTLASLAIPVLIIFVVIFIINIFLMHPTGVADVVSANNAGLISNLNGWFVTHNGDVMHGYISYDGWKDAIINTVNPDGSTLTDDQLQLTNNAKASLDDMVGLGHFFNWKFLWFSEKALYSALIMGWRIYLMITLTTILTGSTQPLELTLAIEDLLWPLKIIGIPIYIISMIISIALRMIPTLLDEAGRIMKAQASRGIDMKNGKTRDKVKSLTSLIIPLLVSAFQKAEDLAYAMDARGYDPLAKRTRYVQFKFRITDLFIFLIGIGIGALMITYAFEFPIAETFLRIPYIDQLSK